MIGDSSKDESRKGEEVFKFEKTHRVRMKISSIFRQVPRRQSPRWGYKILE